MSGLPRISGRECVKALGEAGFYLKRQEGSHMILRRDNPLDNLLYLTIKNLIAVLCVLLFDNQV